MDGRRIQEVSIFIPKNDKWSLGFNMPTKRVRTSMSANVYKDKLYIACDIIVGHWEGQVKWFDCYDFKTGKWKFCLMLPALRTMLPR